MYSIPGAGFDDLEDALLALEALCRESGARANIKTDGPRGGVRTVATGHINKAGEFVLSLWENDDR